MNTFESAVSAFLTDRRKHGDGWTSISDIREVVKPKSDTKLYTGLATYVRLVPGVEVRGGWALGQPFQVRMKEVPS